MEPRVKIYTVGQVNSLVKAAIEEQLPPRLTVRGEISDWKHHSSGHCYFLLKDKTGVLPCVMWASRFKSVKFAPEDGIAVLATGYVDVYTIGGKYQLYLDKLEPEGIGALQLAFEQMLKRLAAQGLFDEQHKKPLPQYPMRIGILTSESGAALHDITESIRHRWHCAKLLFYPVPVQGEGAAAEIAEALREVNRRNRKLRLDVLIVGRGGGSLEDLWAFNEEVLARAIFDSEIPVISAVGHEVDTTIADLVADARASTPTRAGVVAVPDMQEVLSQLAGAERRLTGQTVARLKHARQDLTIVLAGALFRNPLWLVQNGRQQLDDA
ncbi:MAG: exodeoxyribonuclease VII large subunit, partial [Phycisphaerales bacterium]